MATQNSGIETLETGATSWPQILNNNFMLIDNALSDAKSVNTNTTLTVNDRLVLVDASGGNKTITLPATSGDANGNSVYGKVFMIVKTDSSANVVTIATTGGDSLGVTGGTLSLGTQGQSILLVCAENSGAGLADTWVLIGGTVEGNLRIAGGYGTSGPAQGTAFAQLKERIETEVLNSNPKRLYYQGKIETLSVNQAEDFVNVFNYALADETGLMVEPMFMVRYKSGEAARVGKVGYTSFGDVMGDPRHTGRLVFKRTGGAGPVGINYPVITYPSVLELKNASVLAYFNDFGTDGPHVKVDISGNNISFYVSGGNSAWGNASHVCTFHFHLNFYEIGA